MGRGVETVIKGGREVFSVIHKDFWEVLSWVVRVGERWW